MTPLKTGTLAPDFELPDQDGKMVRLSQFRGVSPVVVYFYPKDDTRVCTEQACGFRDRLDEFEGAGAVVLGISGDSAESHRAFRKKFGLAFVLLTDRLGRVRRKYGAGNLFGFPPQRVTFTIDRDGVIRGVSSGVFEAGKHVRESLAAVKATTP